MSLSMRARSSTSRFTERRGQDRIRIAPASRKVIHSGSRNPAPSGLRTIRWRAPAVLFVANNEHGLADERVERVGDHHLKRQTPGIMSSRPGKAA